jgi:hypothetical protein
MTQYQLPGIMLRCRARVCNYAENEETENVLENDSVTGFKALFILHTQNDPAEKKMSL